MGDRDDTSKSKPSSKKAAVKYPMTKEGLLLPQFWLTRWPWSEFVVEDGLLWQKNCLKTFKKASQK